MEKSEILTSNSVSTNEARTIVEVLERLIMKRHDYYARQDKKYRTVVSLMRVIIAVLSLANTIVLGIRVSISEDLQLSIGLVISAISTFVAGLLAYYNFEKYWMRNITKHIKLNILRDSFRCDKVSGKLDDEKIDYYRQQLEEIENDNIEYWKNVSTENIERKEV